ncbi:MAG: S9 family peptidase [Gammaproteobacteria bacterium]|nr:S9 family peptidase [Gammaproteobacteria bacterium]
MSLQVHRNANSSALLIEVVAVGLVLSGCAGSPGRPASPDAKPMPAYPESRRTDHVDTYHGQQVADPYRWLEAMDTPAVKSWVAAQNAFAQPWLEAIPARKRIQERLTQLWNYERFDARGSDDNFDIPVRKGSRYFWLRNDGLQNQSVLLVADGLAAAPRVLIDPNAFSADATVALAQWSVSPGGNYVAYAQSDGGTDWKIWRVRDVATGQDLDDVIRLTKFTGISWEPDGRGFYYTRYPAGGDGRGDDQKQVSIYHHQLGAAQDTDRHVYSITDHATRNPGAEVTDDGRYLVISVFDGYASNGVYYLDLQKPEDGVVRLLDGWDALYTFLGNRGSEFLFQTTAGADRGRIVAIDLARPEPSAWREIVPEQLETLEGASYIGGHLISRYLRDASALVRVYRPDGSLRNSVALPGPGTAAGFTGSATLGETFFKFNSYLTPVALYRYDIAADKVEVFRQPKVAFDPAPYVTEQVFYTSKDGTRVPMFITRRKDAKLDGRNPVLLYGYGGFNVSLTPTYSVPVAVWLEMGGIYAVANLRGGGEYGEAWHEAGTKLRKQNVLDDFISAAEWLISSRYTSSDRLAIHGRSNGGLLVGASLVQRPDLFAAALPGVGVLDMLRYHTPSANARQWSSDYGLSEDAGQFKALLAYSPVHNVKQGGCYPPTLVTTADRDDRVMPWHSYKFGAALQQAQGCSNPVLLRIETRAGHGVGKPTWMQIEDWADQLAFAVRHLQME